MMYFFSTLVHGPYKLSVLVRMTREESTKIVNFITPGAEALVQGHGHISCIVKMHYFFKNFFLILIELRQQTKIGIQV